MIDERFEELEELEILKKANNCIRQNIQNIFDDLDLKETKEDLWNLIGNLIANELEQEELCHNN